MMNDLDTRILVAEQRLIAREQALGLQVDALGRRVRRALQPRRLIGPVLGAALLLVAAGWLIGRVGRRVAAPARAEAPPARESRWIRMAALAWPLLSQVWHPRSGPVAAAVTMGLRLFSRVRRASAGPAEERLRRGHPGARPGGS